LKEGDKLNWAGEAFDILFTPGHSPGSISFYHEKQGFVLSGDVLFRGSIGRTDLPGGDYALLEQSIRQKMYRLPDATKVYPGHGLPTSIEVERKSNPFVKGEEYD
jgi:glyoxylase-like metal-dependent hydrolase (beta-lactamase superfamily II)